MENAHALNTAHETGQNSGLLYSTMLIAAIAVIVFSILGIAAMTGLIPGALSKSDTQPAVAAAQASGGAQVAGQPARSRAAGTPTAAGAGVCVDCGVVSSIRAVSHESAAASGPGAVPGAYAGNEFEESLHKGVNYEIRVHMDDGRYRTFFERAQPALAVGQKVRITDKGIVAG